MGWFEEQIKKRQKLDEKTFEESFLTLAGISSKNQEDEQTQREKKAIAQILSYFHQHLGDIPPQITDFKGKLDYGLKSIDVFYHKVELTASILEGDYEPLVVFSKSNHTPVALIPKGNKGYFFIHPQSGRKVKLHPVMLEKLETEAYGFYRPLPSHKSTLKEYMAYIQRSIRPMDLVLLVVLAAAVSGVGLLLPYLTKVLTGEVAQGEDYHALITFSIYVVSTATGLILLKAIQAFITLRISIKTEKAVQAATMMRVLSLPTSFFKKYNTGNLTSRANSVSRLAGIIVDSVFVTLISAVMSLAYLFQLSSFAPQLILPVVLILLASSAFAIIAAVLQRNYARKQLELSSKEAGVTYEMINGVQKIRLSGSEKRVFAKWAGAYSKVARATYNPPLILRLAPAINLSITLVGNIVLYFIASRTGVTVADYMAFVASYGVLSAAFTSLGQMAGIISTIQPTYELARPILTAETEQNQGKTVLDSIKGNIRLEDVSFRYSEDSRLILDHLSLDIKEGEYVALVGSTGCGKSTFVRLLLGFEKPTQGKVYVDGHDMEELDTNALRRNIGTVMQNGSLFHSDILSNIIISAPNLTEKDAWRAAEIADIAQDIREMPMRMKTVISEGQGGISGGQKQRIMIARAIVHQPKILIFDEATSALDNKTQKSISESIAKLNCTRVVIAHRLSTIQHADRILMLEGGKIIESGNYEELIEKKGRFAELVERQRLDRK